MSLFELSGQIKADGSGNFVKQEMFDETHSFQFADGENGWLETHFAKFSSKELSFWRVRSSGHTVELSSNIHSTFIMPLSGLAFVEADDRSFAVQSNEALLLRPGQRCTHVKAGKDQLYDAFVVLFAEPNRNKSDSLDPRVVEGSCGPGISSFLKYAFEELSRADSILSSDAAQKALSSLFFEHETSQVNSRLSGIGAGSSSSSAGTRDLRLAEEIMRGRYNEPLTIAEIAADIGISERSLQMAFRKFRNMTPWERLSQYRLDAAKSRLEEGSPKDNVSRIAIECGFLHLGRFSAKYQEVFGELPSETLRRAQSRS